MTMLREYLIGVVAAALICCLVKALAGEKGTAAAVIKMLCGVYLCVSVAAPLGQFRISDLSDIAKDYQQSGQEAASYGEKLSAEAMAGIIKAETEAYILDKATSLDADIRVEVILSDISPYEPCAVTVTGKVSPYARTVLSGILETDLGIGKESQKWNS